MEHFEPRGLDRRLVARLLSRTRHERNVGKRIDALSREFIGQSYKANPLIGSAEKPEVFTAALDGFDCVTYIESVLALARATTVDNFVDGLRRIRYEQGQICWARRNHYMTAWIRNNARAGIIAQLPTGTAPTLVRDRVLNVVPGLSPRRTRIKCIAKQVVLRVEPDLQTGDLIFFVSTRSHLDVFHAGIIVADGSQLFLRHASRSVGRVVQQELYEFLKTNRMAGVLIVRPLEIAPALLRRRQEQEHSTSPVGFPEQPGPTSRRRR